MATSNQQPATSNQQPATRFRVWRTLTNGQRLEAEVEYPTRWYLSRRFEQWAKCFGCTQDEAISMFFSDDRASLSQFVPGGLEIAKRLAASGFEKIKGEVIPDLTHFTSPFKFDFSEPDKYGERHARLGGQLDIKVKAVYVTLQIDGGRPAIYLMNYDDMGTVGYARMNGQYAVGGHLTNITMDWTNPQPEDYEIIKMIGTIDRCKATLNLWI